MKQIADAEFYIAAKTCQRGIVLRVISPFTSLPTPAPTLTCNGSQIFEENQRLVESSLIDSKVNELASIVEPKSSALFADTFDLRDKPKVSTWDCTPEKVLIIPCS